MRAFALVFLMTSVFVMADVAVAEGPAAAPKRPRLSQADFDREMIESRSVIHQVNENVPPSPDADLVDPEMVIRSLGQLSQSTFDEQATKKFAEPVAADPALVNAPIYTESVPAVNAVNPEPAIAAVAAVPPPADTKTARSMLNPSAGKTAAESLPAAENHFITPRLKGPSADRDGGSTITSKTRWTFKRKGGGSCAMPGSPDGTAKKAAALKEVLSRFTGNDDFYDSQCTQSCPNKQHSALTSLSVSTAKSTEFDIEQKGIECFYQFRRRPETNWLTLQRIQATCACLPN